ncbi:N-acyl homoserine lactonase family protein [Halorarius litoreus]|uniref:N-acyl homoserine lactonase family protein n=1 Tax=Halorarius litoreus TaxID=2962676 RepID=UPI0020CD6969|nr:N-acyl homoserine lactonase family protein [Halorarius litoreus]
MADVDVHLFDRGRIEADVNFVLDGSTVATASNPNPDLRYEEFLVWNLVIDHPEGTVLWDTGSHPDAGDGYWPAPLYEAFAHVDAADHDLADDLGAAGYGIEDIDAVVMSHLHLDHAGGLYHFAGTDTPIYVHEREIEFAYRSGKTDTGSVAYFPPDFDRELNWEVVSGDHQLYEDFRLLHLPGHTPGLLGAQLDRGDDTLLVVGDEAYWQENYQGHSMAASLLWDNQAWRASLDRLHQLEREHDADVLLGHDMAMLDQFGDGW